VPDILHSYRETEQEKPSVCKSNICFSMLLRLKVRTLAHGCNFQDHAINQQPISHPSGSCSVLHDFS